MSLSIRFRNPSTYGTDKYFFGWTKNDLQLDLQVSGRNAGNFHNLLSTQTNAYISCPQNQPYCESPILFITPIRYVTYQIQVGLLNGKELLDRGLLDSKVTIHYSYTTSSYTLLSILLRCIFIIGSVFFSFFYLIALMRNQAFISWQSEQKFISLLLVLTIIYNNPLFFLQFVVVEWIFSFINTVFTITFFTFLMLTVLVMTHSIITTVSDRSIVWFYAPKFIVVGVIWVYSVTLISIIGFLQQSGGFTIVGVSSTFPFLIILAVLLAIYLGNVGYYFVRSISKITHLPGKKVKKLIFSWGLTFIVLILTIIDTLLFAAGVQVGAVQFNVFFVAYNTYTVTMAILYWPTNTEEFKNQQEEIEEREQLIKSDEHFESYN